MKLETRLLYWGIILIIELYAIFSMKQSYKHGYSDGKLSKMEEFKTTFMPSPKNVYPDPIPEYPEADE